MLQVFFLLRYFLTRYLTPFRPFLFPSEGLCPETKSLLSSTSKKKGKGGSKGGAGTEEETRPDSQPVTIHLHFKRYVFDPHKKMIQR